MRLLRACCVVISTCPLLASCMVGPNFHSPKPPQTERYTYSPLPNSTVGIKKSGTAGNPQAFRLGRDIPAEWWELFHSDEINAMVEKGIENSPNLAAAEAALRQAKDTLYSQIGNLLLPKFDATGYAERARISGLGFGIGGPSNVFNVFNTTVSVSYLLDIFGGSRRQIEALQAQVDYQRYQLIAAYLTLTSNIVTTAVTVASLEAQIKATNALIHEEALQLKIIKKQFQLGGASQQTIFTQQTLLAQTQSLLPPLQTNLERSRHALAVLIGELPSDMPPPTINLDKLILPANIPVSLPSSLVCQRPDIQAAEAVLHAASAQIGVATANMLPQITLTGDYGWTGQTVGNLFNSTSKVWDLGMSIAQPIFHGGALFWQRKAAIATFEQAEAQYKQTVLQAFQNVADALKTLEGDARAFKAKREAEISAKATYTLTSKQYRLGATSYLNLLTAEQQYQQAVINRIQAQSARYTDTTALFAALGGGWWNRVDQKYPCKGGRFC